MWPFSKRQARSTLGAAVSERDGRVIVDVRGQTCPGYLLSINRAVETLGRGTEVSIVTSYAPCGPDVEAWCKEKGYQYGGIEIQQGAWHLTVTT